VTRGKLADHHEGLSPFAHATRVPRGVRDRLRRARTGDAVPHYAPDQNPFADEFVKLSHLPREAVLGYPETLYPEYLKKIKDTYVPPPPCTESCDVAGHFVVRR
jgi:hypothetical protein